MILFAPFLFYKIERPLGRCGSNLCTPFVDLCVHRSALGHLEVDLGRLQMIVDLVWDGLGPSHPTGMGNNTVR